MFWLVLTACGPRPHDPDVDVCDTSTTDSGNPATDDTSAPVDSGDDTGAADDTSGGETGDSADSGGTGVDDSGGAAADDTGLPLEGMCDVDPPVPVSEDRPTMFLSSVHMSGNMGGIEGADFLCTVLARRAGRSGPYKAWLALGTSTWPGDRITYTGPWYEIGASPEVVLDDATQLSTTWLLRVHHDEFGTHVPAGEGWTGMRSGTPKALVTGQDCDGWTSADAATEGLSYDFSETSGNSPNTGSGEIGCDHVRRIWCVADP